MAREEVGDEGLRDLWQNRKRNSDVNNVIYQYSNVIYQSARSKHQNNGSIVRKKQKNELLDLVQLKSFHLTQISYLIVLLTIIMIERTSRQTNTKYILRKMRLEDQAI